MEGGKTQLPGRRSFLQFSPNRGPLLETAGALIQSVQAVPELPGMEGEIWGGQLGDKLLSSRSSDSLGLGAPV